VYSIVYNQIFEGVVYIDGGNKMACIQPDYNSNGTFALPQTLVEAASRDGSDNFL
jgi:hypothetical protein